MTRFLIIFIALLTIFFTIEMLGPVQRHMVQPFTALLAHVSATLVAPFDDQVVTSGRVIRHIGNQFAVSIEAGCNGVEAIIVLAAAVIAFPAGSLQKLAGITIGFIAIQSMNILRIVSLFYLGMWNMEVFRWTHLYLWPVLIMLDALVVFLLYLRILDRQEIPP